MMGFQSMGLVLMEMRRVIILIDGDMGMNMNTVMVMVIELVLVFFLVLYSLLISPCF